MPTSFTPDREASTFRKIAAAMWAPPNDPTIYGVLDVDAVPVLAAVERLRASTGAKVTVTHVVARCVALLFQRYPEVNAKVRWWGKIERRNQVDVFIQVATEGGRDLSGARIQDADKKGIVELAREIGAQAEKIRKSEDPNYAKSRGLFNWLPWWLVRPVLRAAEFIVNELHIDMSGSGMPLDPFGSAMVTSLGMHGVDFAFAPFTPIARCPMVVLVTETKSRPWVDGDKVVVRPVLRLCASFDHRVIDGVHAARMAQLMGQLLGDEKVLGDVSPEAPTLTGAEGKKLIAAATALAASASAASGAPGAATPAQSPAEAKR
jgi:pyruvate dehydrogenase E2 component (dihydrolipoamide acetyltransferase)